MKILLVRNTADEFNPKFYNSQEIGLAKAFIHKGIECDIVYYTKRKPYVESVYSYNGLSARIIWMKGINVLKNAIYPQLLRSSFLKQYDIVQSAEYNQLMTLLFTYICPNKLFVYHGPYQYKRLKWFYQIYNLIFKRRLNKHILHVFTKSLLAESYLRDLGVTQVSTVGVGLDIDRFLDTTGMKIEIPDDIKILTYVGVLEERRNIKFLFDVLKIVIDHNPKVMLLIVGDGKPELVKLYFDYAKKIKVFEHIIYYPKIEQDRINHIYQRSDLLVFPSTYDIFGMVLLESMYFKLPVISSYNGGSVTLIQNNITGFIIDNFDPLIWSKKILEILQMSDIDLLRIKAHNTIVSNFTWNAIADKMLPIYKKNVNIT